MPCKIHNAFLAVTSMCGTLVLGPGIEPMNLALEAEVLTTGPPGKSPHLLAWRWVLPFIDKELTSLRAACLVRGRSLLRPCSSQIPKQISLFACNFSHFGVTQDTQASCICRELTPSLGLWPLPNAVCSPPQLFLQPRHFHRGSQGCPALAGPLHHSPG